MPRRSTKKRSFPRRTKKKRISKRRNFRVLGDASTLAHTTIKPIQTRPIKWITPKGQLPERVLVKMTYTDGHLAYAPAATSGSYVFRINSIFDPDSLVANQPSLHDAFATLYKKYHVSGCQISIDVLNASAYRTTTGLIISDTAAAGTFTEDIVRRSASMSTVLDVVSKERNSATFKCFVPMKSIVGAKYKDTVYSADFGSAPSDTVWAIVPFVANGAAGNVSVQMSVSLTFYVECFDPLYERAID